MQGIGLIKCSCGQARKSLWIETFQLIFIYQDDPVRLVRACGSKLFYPLLHSGSICGQARKSLWIETNRLLYFNVPFVSVRLVRACGSKPSGNRIANIPTRVRLVRACGSKLWDLAEAFYQDRGQARKSLWIETEASACLFPESVVRLVRACGSKLGRPVDIAVNHGSGS